MGRGISEDKNKNKGNNGDKRTDNQAACKGKPGRRQKPEAPEPTTADLIKITLDHFFPDFNDMVLELDDPRLPERITYSVKHLIYLGLCMYLFYCGSRNQLYSDRKSINFHRNLLRLSGTGEEFTASPCAMNYLMEEMDSTDNLELIPGKMTAKLIRSRVFDKFRNLQGDFLVAVDAVHIHTEKGKHSNCVYKTVNGETDSYYYVLEAKLITQNGMGFSIASVFIENEEEYEKQDCELKAFYRLAKILEKRFPRLPMCLLFDGLYPNKNVLEICRKNKWGHYITLKSGCCPKLYNDAMVQIRKNPGNSLFHQTEDGAGQHILWTDNLKYDGQRTYLLICKETKFTPADGVQTKTFVWITNIKPTKDNAVQMVKEGRCRWHIEEAFNIQKNGGYELEHNYGTVGYARKNYYYLLQIAHILHQLMIRSDLFPNLQKKFILHEYSGLPKLIKAYIAVVAESTIKHFRTIKNFVKKLLESFRNHKISEMTTNQNYIGKLRVRLDSS